MTQSMIRIAILTLLFLCGGATWAQVGRKPVSKPAPIFPDLAKRMNVSGIVKLELTVAPNGQVKNAKAIGGHPLLIDAASDAVRKWKYEPASAETTEAVEFRFNSAN